MALWTLAEQQTYKPINNLQEGRFRQLQAEVEINDVPQYVGFEFYQELVRNAASYATLLDGGSYSLNGYTYTFRGLKAMFAFILYARYVRESAVQDTFSGMVVHTGEGISPVSQGGLKDMENRYLNIAGSIWEETLKYICTLNLPFFHSENKRTIKITAL